MRHLAFLERAERWPRERVRAYQLERLRTLVRTASAEVPFYRALYDQPGIDADDLRSLDDLCRLPVATKPLLRAALPERARRETGKSVWMTSSSGSTGENFGVWQDAETLGRLRALNMLAFEWSGWPVGAMHVQTGMTLERGFVKKLKDKLFRCHYVNAFDLTDRHLDGVLDVIVAEDIRHLRGYPGSLYYLAQRALARGIEVHLDSIATWGDNLFAHYRQAIETAFHRRVHDVYGCAEGIMIAAQCGHDNAYHELSPDVIVEVLDDNGQPTPPGQFGHVILTRLHPGPTPLIRYQVGDLAMSCSDEPCACGRGFRVIGGIQGRDTDVVLTPSGNRLIVHFFTGIIEFFGEVDSFQVLQNTMDAIVVNVVPRQGYTPRVGDAIAEALRAKGADLRIEVRTVDAIPPTRSGKRRFVISELQRERFVAP
jgi:phenylacetate-CoA ligase